MPNIRQVHQTQRIVIGYRNRALNRNVSHIGLGVSASQNTRSLRNAGYMSEVWALASGEDLGARIKADKKLASAPHHVPITHVVVSAPWITTAVMSELVHTYPDIEFVVLSHSNVGFLQADPNAILLLRQGSELAKAMPNFHIGANSPVLQSWWEAAYQQPMLLLPNMYPFTPVRHKPAWQSGLLRIGCFGAMRPQKNILTAAAAALEVGARLRASDLEFYVSGGRVEGGGTTIRQAIAEMYADVPRAKVIQNDWESWPQFLSTVGAMDLMLQPSYTETFNMVTADGISRGVASVVGDAIFWAPKAWVAGTDSAVDIANKAIALLHDPGAIDDGVRALQENNKTALTKWEQFLELKP